MPGTKPKMLPTRFGPLRSCIQPMTLRSHNVVNATDRIRETVTTRIQNVERTNIGRLSQNARVFSIKPLMRPDLHRKRPGHLCLHACAAGTARDEGWRPPSTWER